MKLQLKKASTNVTVYVFVQDSSATTGAGLTGLVFNSAGLVASQVRPLAARVAITLVTQTVTGAHSDGGFVEVDATNMPGIYRLDLPNAVCATGVDSAIVMLKGATNMAPVVLEIQLTDFDLNDADPAVDVTKWNGAAVATPDTAGHPKVTIKDGTGTGELDTTVGKVGIKTSGIGSGTIAAGAIVSASFGAGAINAAALAADAVNEIRDAILADSTAFNGADIAALIARLTAARAAYMDNLNVGGLVASSVEVVAIQNNTRIVAPTPPVMERPDSGSTAYKLHLYLYDTNGDMEAPDSLPTITAENQAGVTRSANLGTVTLVSTGHYTVTYTLASGDAIEQLVFQWTVVEGANTLKIGRMTMVVDTTAVDFTSADRTKLDTLHDTRLTAARAINLDNLDALVSTRATAANLTTVLNRLGAITGGGDDTVLGYFKALLSKAAATPGDIGGTFNPATDSVEALQELIAAGSGQLVVDTTVAVVTDQTHLQLTAALGIDDTYNDALAIVYDVSASDTPSVHKVTDFADVSNVITLDSTPKFTVVAGDKVRLFAFPPGTTAPTAAQNADAVWDELTAAHRIAGSFGLALQLARALAANKKIVYHAQSNKLEIYDDDGTTLLLTMTPTADTVGNKTTITPS